MYIYICIYNAEQSGKKGEEAAGPARAAHAEAALAGRDGAAGRLRGTGGV